MALYSMNTPLQDAFSPCDGILIGKLYLDMQRFICVLMQPEAMTLSQISFVQFRLAQGANRLSRDIYEDFANRHPLCNAAKPTFTTEELNRTQVYIQQ